MKGQIANTGDWRLSCWVRGTAAVALMTGFGATATTVPTSYVPAGPGSSIILAWNPSPDPSVSGYRVYQGTNSRNYTLVYDAGNGTNKAVPGLQIGAVYYFAATAYDTNGLESDFSAELVYTNATGGTPTITNFVKTADGNFSISGFGAAGQSCVLLATTNLQTPLTWTPVVTNTVDVQGYFSFLDFDATNYPSRFYQVLQLGTPLGPINLPLSAHR